MSSRLRNAVDTVVKTLSGSKPEKRLSACLPPADRPITDKDGQLKHYTGWHVFASEFAREQFIKTVLILLSENGKHNLNHLSFNTFYNRAYDREGKVWYTTSIVAMDEYSILHTLMAPHGAMTKSAAFNQLLLEVEAQMGVLLTHSSGIPDVGTVDSSDLQPSTSTVHQGNDSKMVLVRPQFGIIVDSDDPTDVEGAIPPLKPNSVANLSVFESAVRRSFTLRY